METKTINIKINGKNKQINSCMTIAELMTKLDINIKLIAIALNGVVIRRLDLDKVQIYPKDEIEIVRAVGGG
ncbi:MAG: sulfur carrier protein [Chloroflexi bacterium]|jgi:thiamine biosynthesis protein ThiS|nr:MAG: sulfur carrier protein [Chloroflexota bacterium]